MEELYDDFFDVAAVENTRKSGAPGTAKYQKLYPNLTRVRKYKDPRTGEIRTTVELDLGALARKGRGE